MLEAFRSENMSGTVTAVFLLSSMIQFGRLFVKIMFMSIFSKVKSTFSPTNLGSGWFLWIVHSFLVTSPMWFLCVTLWISGIDFMEVKWLQLCSCDSEQSCAKAGAVFTVVCRWFAIKEWFDSKCCCLLICFLVERYVREELPISCLVKIKL